RRELPHRLVPAPDDRAVRSALEHAPHLGRRAARAARRGRLGRADRGALRRQPAARLRAAGRLLTMTPAARALAARGLVLALGACATRAPSELRPLTPRELRDVLRKRLPDVPEADLVVPWEVGPEAIARAELLTKRRRLDSERVRALVDALSDPEGFAL